MIRNQTFTFKISKGERDLLSNEAKKECGTESQIIRKALKLYFEQQNK